MLPPPTRLSKIAVKSWHKMRDDQHCAMCVTQLAQRKPLLKIERKQAKADIVVMVGWGDEPMVQYRND